MLVAAAAAEVVVVVGRAEAEAEAGECRQQPAVYLPWAEAWEHDPRLVPQAVRLGRLALPQVRAAQCVREPALVAQCVRARGLVARDREPARADPAETLRRVPAPLPAN